MRSEDHMMTWTQRIKAELSEIFDKSQKCRKAELQAILLLNPGCIRKDEQTGIFIYEDSVFQNKNHFTGRRKTYNIKGNFDPEADPRSLYKDLQSKRAFLRGAFLATGSMTDPNKSYQLELTAPQEWQAVKLQELMADFDILSRVVTRRDKHVVYLKEGLSIADMLNVIGAHKALLEFENIRIIKEMRGSVNRQVNCETANINKVVTASMKQLEDIELIRDEMGFDNLNDNLRQICIARLSNPDVALSELGNLVCPPVGKSGVNHRLRKISSIAKEIREKKGEVNS